MNTTQVVKPSCSFCNKEMRFVEGDVIFGEKWFHKDCAPKYKSILTTA